MNSKSAIWLGLAAGVVLPLLPLRAQDSNPPASATISPLAADLVRLAESGVSEEVQLAYVHNAQGRFDLSADAILYLKDEGIATPVVTEMLNHDRAVVPNPQTSTKYVYDQKVYAPTTPSLPPPPITEQVPPPPVALPTPSAPPPAPVPIPATPPPAYVSDAPAQVSYFYNDLSPYGTWVNLDGYGWCWQPRVLLVNRQWRPYCDGGYWVNTDAGWCWQSEYSWGWAPFHYGRWHFHDRVGWVWFPDTTWGPGWVVWRNEGEHCGWAPLPFRAEFDVRSGYRFNGVNVRADFDFGLGAGLFTFIAIKDFGEHDYGRHRLPPAEVTRIYSHTTVINNYVVNENHVVINRGIPKERVEAATHTTIRTVAIHNEPERKGAPGITQAGGVYKHEIKTPAAPVRMVAQKVDERHPVVQHAAIVPPKVEQRPAFTPANSPGHSQKDVRPASQGNSPRSQNNYVAPGTGQSAASFQTPAHPVEKAPVHPQNYAAPTPSHQYVTTPANPQLNQENVKPRPPNNFATPNASQPLASTPARQAPNNIAVQAPAAPPLQVRNNAVQNNQQLYYPKSYNQASEAHLPPSPPNQNLHGQTGANNGVRASPQQPSPQKQLPNNSGNTSDPNHGK
ncbi:MAG: hypothetical protein JWQ04_723 [Pedosphaera sp.]|nr:hypothetical protein [Pedosphaera sp.]